MPLTHLLLALSVVGIWGSNFVVIKIGLEAWPPTLFTALRFLGAAFPLLLFVRRPAVSWPQLAALGLLGALQFGLMFWALGRDIAPGLASLVIQVQAFFTIGLAMWLGGERPRPVQGAALALALAGIVLIATHSEDGPAAAGMTMAATPLGLAMVIAAALAWSGTNLVARSVGRADMLGVMVWSSALGGSAAALASLWIDGPAVIAGALQHAGGQGWAAVAWQAVGNTLFGYGVWNWLMARHPAATVAPIALLVPVFGMSASALLLGETMPAWKLGATALVLAGLAVNTVASRPAGR